MATILIKITSGEPTRMVVVKHNESCEYERERKYE